LPVFDKLLFANVTAASLVVTNFPTFSASHL